MYQNKGKYNPHYSHKSNQPVNPDAKSLWMGDIDRTMNEAYIANLFASTGKCLL